MNDYSKELLVKKMTSTQDRMIQTGMIVLCVLLFFVGLFLYPIVLLAAVVMVGVTYFVNKRLNKEYEYLFVAGELSVDVIYSMQRRKHCKTIALENMELLALQGSHHLKPYEKLQITDYSAQDARNRPYVLIISEDHEKKQIYLQLDDALVSMIAMHNPRIVFRD
ncbi:MAG: hypothetical protein ACK5MN_11595 [Lachnospiraceae bacterium]